MILKNKKIFLSEKGAVALPSILILSIIILAVGLAMSFSGFTQNNITRDQNKGMNALYIAEAGTKDALIKISRNMDYDTSFLPGGSYCLKVGESSAKVIVTDIALSVVTEIESTGILNNTTCASSSEYSRKIKASVDVISEGEVNIASWEELSN